MEELYFVFTVIISMIYSILLTCFFRAKLYRNFEEIENIFIRE